MRFAAGRRCGPARWWGVCDVGGEASGVEGGDVLLGRDKHLAAHVAALLGRAELVLPVDAGGAGLDHALHEFVGVERATEAGFGVGDDPEHVVNLGVAVGLAPLDLVGTTQGVVDAGHNRQDGVGGVQRLVGVDLAGEVGVSATCQPR